jgi:hypothetical protein
MIVYILVFVFQVMFNVFKTLEIKYTYENKVVPLIFNSVWINLVSLASTYFSLERLFARDWPVIVVYISGSVFGKWVAMTQVDNYRKKIYEFIKNRVPFL